MKGFDVSEFQGTIDFQKIGKNYEFMIARAGYGIDISQKDKCFDANVSGAAKAGLKIGAYWFSYATNADEARKEADVCAAAIEKNKANITLPVFFDWEYASYDYATRKGTTPTKSLVTEMAIAFMERIKKHGYSTGYYTNLDYMSRMLDYEKLKEYPLWLAQYEGDAKYPYYIRQTSAKGQIAGITGNVDLDEMKAEAKPESTYKEIRITYGDIVATVAKAYGCTEDAILKLNGRTKSEIVTSLKIPMKSVDAVAKEIIAGKGGWGSWPLRSVRLKAAGYDPSAVQDRINQLKKEGYF